VIDSSWRAMPSLLRFCGVLYAHSRRRSSFQSQSLEVVERWFRQGKEFAYALNVVGYQVKATIIGSRDLNAAR